MFRFLKFDSACNQSLAQLSTTTNLENIFRGQLSVTQNALCADSFLFLGILTQACAQQYGLLGAFLKTWKSVE